MADRKAPIDAFLKHAGWSGAQRQPLAGDASGRIYERVRDKKGKRAVLMDIGPTSSQDLRPFVMIASHLNDIGLSAPEVFASDYQNGLLLLEDFGDRVFARQMAEDSALERTLYDAAIDTLSHLHRAPLPDALSRFSAAELVEFASLVYEWYLPQGARTRDTAYSLKAELTRLLASLADHQPVLALRDFHSENMIWLPDREGARRVGLLDFQDAFLCHPAYDLVSMLRDARRDLSPGLDQHLLDRYIRCSDCDADALGLAVAVYGAQRNLRILGVFARLSLNAGKTHYVDLIPRVWQHLMTDLDHPALKTLRRIVLRDLPEPDTNHLNLLKVPCPINRKP